MTVNRSYFMSAAIGSALVVTLAVHSRTANAEATDSSELSLTEIIVTAQKHEESLSKVGMTVQVVGAQQLQERNVASLQDLAAAVPGLGYTQTDTATPVYTLRGVGFYDSSLAASPAVSIYLDQAPLPFPVEATLTLFDLERVEVLKGPQGTLFGNNATGGAINYIAAKPTADFKAGGDVTYGRFNTVSTNGFISGPLASNLGGRIAISTSNGEGWQRSDSRPDDKNGAPDTLAARALLDWRPTDRLHAEVNLNGWRYRTEPQQAQYVEFVPSFPDAVALIPPGDFKFIPNANQDSRSADWTATTKPRADNKLYQATIHVDYYVTDAIELASISSYTNYDQHQAPVGTAIDANRVNYYLDNGSVKNVFQELRLADNSNGRFRWTVGANYENDKIFEDQRIDSGNGTAFYTPDFFGILGQRFTSSSSRQSVKTTAGFANGEYSLGALIFKAGVRYTDSHRTSTNCTFSPVNDPILAVFGAILGGPVQPFQCFNINTATFTPGAFTGNLNQDNLSWRTGVDWNPADNALVYANVAKGYKAGSFPTVTGATQVSFTPAKQESVLSYELGAKTNFFNRRLLVNATVYHSDYDDKQIRSKLVDPIFGPLPALVNVPKSTINGAELEISTRPVTGLTLGTSINYLHTKLDDTRGPDGNFLVSSANNQADFAGNPIPYSPKWSLAGNANYEFPISGDIRGFVGGQAAYRSQTNSSIGDEPIMDIPSYWTLDLQAGAHFKDGRYSLMVWGKNVTDKFYLTNRYFSFDGVTQYTGMPAAFGVTFAARL
jgi:outer membrane receptor protein involved in Fe transport